MNQLKVARIISNIFIPPTISFILVLYFSINYSNSITEVFLNFIILFTAVVFLPIIFFIYQRKMGIIINNDAVIKEERTNVYLFALSVFTITYIILIVLKTAFMFRVFILVYILSTGGVFLINKNFKISVHTITAAGASAFFYFSSLTLMIIFLILTLLIMWSRVKLNVHTKAEVVAGFLYGFFLTFLIINGAILYAS